MKQVPIWRPTNIRCHHRTKFSLPGDLGHWPSAPLPYTFILAVNFLTVCDETGWETEKDMPVRREKCQCRPVWEKGELMPICETAHYKWKNKTFI